MTFHGVGMDFFWNCTFSDPLLVSFVLAAEHSMYTSAIYDTNTIASVTYWEVLSLTYKPGDHAQYLLLAYLHDNYLNSHDLTVQSSSDIIRINKVLATVKT